MAFTKAACTLVDLGLGAFVAEVCDLTHSFYYTDTYTQKHTHPPEGRRIEADVLEPKGMSYFFCLQM